MFRPQHPARLLNPPTIVEHNQMRFVITDAPSDINLPLYIAEFQHNGVTDVVRVCEPTYDTMPLQRVGIKVHEYPSVVDGSTPSHTITQQWLDLVYKRFGHDRTIRPRGAIACHCVAGLGRAPLLVAIALIEGGMSAEDSIQFIRSKRRGALNTKQIKYIQHYKPRKSRSKAKCVIL
ncbi:Protein tyrosine phosphatase type IVA 1 [Actinomortierella ambigua]|uniref:protein-tyrosine-phosphatase n=1 Tax=Actinomortierella ambigua TaxID=1343610 RepID=A0A9P6PVC9_9FUNG|nr:Protein tyrosine phosphatase type IVA 1 [Actinomortierella ambigua]